MVTGPESTTTPTRRRSFASSGLTYEQVARELGLRLCAGSCPLAMHGFPSPLDTPEAHARRHERGWVTIVPLEDVVHWSRERVTRRGLYHFLRLASQLLYTGDTIYKERWLALYYTDWHARRLARKFRVRIPKEYGAGLKARARLDLAKIRPSDLEFPEQRELYRRVREWSRTNATPSTQTRSRTSRP